MADDKHTTPRLSVDWYSCVGCHQALRLRHLVKMNWNMDDSWRPLMFQFVMKNLEGVEFHATYSGIMIDRENLTLASIGDYHGTAGDELVYNLGQPFEAWKPEFHRTLYWWFQRNSTNKVRPVIQNIRWGRDVMSMIRLRIRPEAYDKMVSCPLLNVMEPTWDTVEMVIPVSRALGANITYNCVGEYIFEGVPDGDRTVEGTLVCVTSQVTGYLEWSQSVVLPCTIMCPPNFLVNDDTNCLYLSSAPEPLGFVGAALRCGEQNATLASIALLSDLMNVSSLSYTADSLWWRKNGSAPEPSCLDPCEVGEGLECLAVTSSGQKQAVACDRSDLHYICILPPLCPDGYSEYKGHCYKLVEVEASFLSALAYCSNEGSMLAYPQSFDVLAYLADLLRGSENPQVVFNSGISIEVMLGLHDVLGDWTVGNLYSPDAAIIDAASDTMTPYHWRVLSVPEEKTAALTLIPTPLENHTAVYAFCQYPGPKGCSADPPTLTDAVIGSWNNDTALLTSVEYLCSPGYFLNGSIGEISQSTTCIGQLGEWILPSSHCIAVEVCLEPLGAPSHIITNITGPDFRYLNSTVNFTCPEMMTTLDGLQVQVLTCVEQSGEYVFSPQVVSQCNVCSAEPVIGNASSDWVNTTTWTVGMNLTFTCNENYNIYFGVNTGVLICSETGWITDDTCYEACSAPPVVSNMAMQNFSSDAVGTKLNYTCDDGFFLPITSMFPNVTTSTIIECTPNGMWMPIGPSPLCTTLCMEEPPKASGMVVSSWDNFNRSFETEIKYSCPDGMLLGNYEQTVTVSCAEDGNWTSVDPTILHCKTPAPVDPPSTPVGATFETADENLWVGSVINYTCKEGQMSQKNVTFFTIWCTSVGWSQLDPEFACYNICTTPPPVALDNVKSNFSGISFWGKVIEYTCINNSMYFNYTTVETCICEDGNWTLSYVPPCYTDLPVLPEPPPNVYNMTPSPYPVGSNITYMCGPGQLSLSGESFTTITRSTSDWTALDPDFACYNSCMSPPEIPWSNATYNFTGGSTWGTVVLYTCNGTFLGGGNSRINECLEDGNWSLFILPQCFPPGDTDSSIRLDCVPQQVMVTRSDALACHSLIGSLVLLPPLIHSDLRCLT